MTLRNTNLNLLPILRALLTEASITRAAATLGLSQPATSHALGKLRIVFCDPLLVQVGRTMRLTSRGEELRARIDRVCVGIEDLLLDREFDPKQVVRDFTVATPDYMALLLGPRLIRSLADAAPRVAVRLTNVGPDFSTHLASGGVDVAIVAYVEKVACSFNLARGYMDRLVGVVAKGHPLATRPNICLADLSQYPQLGIDPRLHGSIAAISHTSLMLANDSPLKLSASHLLALPLLIAETDAIAILPRALADKAAQMVPIVSFELPPPVIPLEICMMWSPVNNADAAQAWFRLLLHDAMSEQFVRADATVL